MKQKQILSYFKILNRKYNKKRKQWIRDVMKYKGKLQIAVNDESFLEEFKQYLKRIGKYDIFKNEIKLGFEVNPDDVKGFKENSNHFMHWLIKYKDKKANDLIQMKPQAPIIQKLPNIEFCACTKLSMLRHRLISNNPKLNYYMINIKIKKTMECNDKILFKDPRHRNWRRVQRCLLNVGAPFCNDI